MAESELLETCLHSAYAETLSKNGAGARVRFQDALKDHVGFREAAQARLDSLAAVLAAGRRCYITQIHHDFLERELKNG